MSSAFTQYVQIALGPDVLGTALKLSFVVGALLALINQSPAYIFLFTKRAKYTANSADILRALRGFDLFIGKAYCG